MRRWVDHDLGHKRRPVSPYLPFLVILGPLIAIHDNASIMVRFWLWGSLPLALLAEGFVLWRAARVIKACQIVNARRYERRDRYSLPPEYASSESAYLAERRKRIGQVR